MTGAETPTRLNYNKYISSNIFSILYEDNSVMNVYFSFCYYNI